MQKKNDISRKKVTYHRRNLVIIGFLLYLVMLSSRENTFLYLSVRNWEKTVLVIQKSKSARTQHEPIDNNNFKAKTILKQKCRLTDINHI